MPRLPEDVLESIKIFSEDRKIKVLEELGDKEFQEIADSIDGRSYKFVYQTFETLEELRLAERTDIPRGTGGNVEVERTRRGNVLLDLEGAYRNDFDRAVERFFDSELRVDSTELIHELVEYNGGNMLELKSKGVPDQFLHRPRAASLFYSIDPNKSVSDYAEEFDVSNNTVRTWIRGLEDEGLIIEERDGHSKKFFYGAFAFPLLKLGNNLEAAYETVGSLAEESAEHEVAEDETLEEAETPEEAAGEKERNIAEEQDTVEEEQDIVDADQEYEKEESIIEEEPVEKDLEEAELEEKEEEEQEEGERESKPTQFRSYSSREREPGTLPWSQRFGNDEQEAEVASDGGLDDHFEVFRDEDIDWVYDQLRDIEISEETFEDDFNQESKEGYGIHRVVTVNQDSVVMSGGYLWENPRPVEEGEYVLVEYGEDGGIGLSEAEGVAKVDFESLREYSSMLG